MASGKADHLPDIVPPGNGSKRLSSTGVIMSLRYAKLRDNIDNGNQDSDHEP